MTNVKCLIVRLLQLRNKKERIQSLSTSREQQYKKKLGKNKPQDY